MDIVKISPESLEVANAYLTSGSLVDTANFLGLPHDMVAEILAKREVKAYIDEVFLDQGYRNRTKLHALLDEIIDSKLKEARETEMYTKKDIVDLISLVHKMRMDERKAQQEAAPQQQTNVQINSGFGSGNYGELMRKLLECPES